MTTTKRLNRDGGSKAKEARPLRKVTARLGNGIALLECGHQKPEIKAKEKGLEVHECGECFWTERQEEERAEHARRGLTVACASCGAEPLAPCKNYLGKRKATCPGRTLQVDAASGALAARRHHEPLSTAEIAELLAAAPAQRVNPHGFVRVDPKPWTCKLTAEWLHPSGWRARHCGHPTAHHPWALYDPTGAMICTGAKISGNPLNGTAWNLLDEAQAWAAGQVELDRRRAASEAVSERIAADTIAGRKASAAKKAKRADPEINPASPCARCGEPTIRGVNSDFCSLACEEAAAAAELRLEVQEPPPRRAAGWGTIQLDLFQRSLCEAPVQITLA